MTKADYIRSQLAKGKTLKEISKEKFDGKKIYDSEVRRLLPSEFTDGVETKASLKSKKKDGVKRSPALIDLSASEAKASIDDVFLKIINVKSISDLQSIEQTLQGDFDEIKYPRIQYSILRKEAHDLIQGGVFNSDFSIKQDVLAEQNALTRILYSVIWKRGDLAKIKHLVRGILNSGEELTSQDEALVFYQFGKHMQDKQSEPIIDQHTLRAFKVYESNDEKQIATFQKWSSLTKKDKEAMQSYKSWMLNNTLPEKLKKEMDYGYYIDRILFLAGKRIKVSRKLQ